MDTFTEEMHQSLNLEKCQGHLERSKINQELRNHTPIRKYNEIIIPKPDM